MLSVVTGRMLGKEKMTMIKHVQRMQFRLAAQPSLLDDEMRSVPPVISDRKK
jgi:hypothetical protein